MDEKKPVITNKRTLAHEGFDILKNYNRHNNTLDGDRMRTKLSIQGIKCKR
jgi:adenylylsulfate kinase-like enzyme